MVDSTALRSRLGDDRADLLRSQHDNLLVDAIDAHRGTVLRWTGDGVDAEATWLVQTGHLAYQAGTLGQMLHAVEAMTTGTQSRMWSGALAVAVMWAGDDHRAAEILDADPELNGRSATGNTTSTNATADHDDRTRVSLQP